MPTLNHTPTKRPWMRERKAHERRKVSNAAFYNAGSWRNLALRHKYANPFCADPFHRGCCLPVKVTDHVIPVNQGGSRLDWDNLQSLCEECNPIKTAYDGVLAKRGVSWSSPTQYMEAMRQHHGKRMGKEAHKQ